MIFWNDVDSIEKMKQALQADQVVLASGDTVLGLWGNLTLSAFAKINQIKQRNDKPYLITIGSMHGLQKFTDQILTDRLQTLIETCWPGPVTLIFQARQDLPSWMVGQDKTVALRVPDHDGLLKLLTHFDGLFSTSANITGHSIPNCIDQIDPALLQQVALICAQKEAVCYSNSPSTILDCSSGKIEIIRSGAFDVANLADLLT